MIDKIGKEIWEDFNNWGYDRGLDVGRTGDDPGENLLKFFHDWMKFTVGFPLTIIA